MKQTVSIRKSSKKAILLIAVLIATTIITIATVTATQNQNQNINPLIYQPLLLGTKTHKPAHISKS